MIDRNSISTQLGSQVAVVLIENDSYQSLHAVINCIEHELLI
jgi:hypothetical protein